MLGYQELLARLKDIVPGSGGRATFLIGSGVTIPEVPGVEAVIGAISDALPHTPGAQSRFHTLLAAAPSAQRYSVATRYFATVRGVDELNRLVQRMVLRAVQPGTAALAAEPSHEELRDLERRHASWRLNRGVETLGKLIWNRRDLFPGPVLTTNFDPLIEVSLRRAGANPLPVILSEDGDPEQVAPDRDMPMVVHLHGWWRGAGDTLHTDDVLTRDRPHLRRWLESVLHEHIVVVLGYGGWQDVFMRTLRATPTDAIKQVYWCFYEKEHEIPGEKLARVESLAGHPRVVCLADIDAQVLLPALWEELRSPETELGAQETRAGLASKGTGTGAQRWSAPEEIPSESATRIEPDRHPPTTTASPPHRSQAEVAVGTRRKAMVKLLGLAILAAGLVLWLAHPVSRRMRVNVPIEDHPAHLGDDVFATFLAPDPAQVPNPLSQRLRDDLIFFDKDSLSFEARSVSAGQAALLEHLSAAFSRLDFSSYRHVRLVDESELRTLGLDPVPSPRVVAFADGRFLVWARNQGNFHLSKAAVVLTHRVDIAGRIRAELPSPGNSRITGIGLSIELAHAGKPHGEGGEILLCVGRHLVDLSPRLDESEIQNRQTVEVDITRLVSVDRGPTELSVVTTPIRETTPIPGPLDPDPGARPVHFRDVMINRMVLLVDLAVRD